MKPKQIKISQLKWCPKGCGKKVFYLPSKSESLNLPKGYTCLKCKTNWSIREFKKDDKDM